MRIRPSRTGRLLAAGLLIAALTTDASSVVAPPAARAADPLARLCNEVDCAVGELALAHARALAAGDGAALRAVSDDLAAVGMRAAAASARSAAAQADLLGG